VIAVGPLHRDFDGDAVLLAGDGDDRLVHGSFVAVEILDERLEPALVVELGRFRLDVAGVGQDQPHARIEERQLAQAMLQRREVELGLGERLWRWQEGNLGAPPRFTVLDRGIVDDRERRFRIAVVEAHEMLFAVAPDAQVESARQRVDNGDADAVQTTGDLVGVLVELPAGVQLRHHHLGGGDALLAMDLRGDAAAVVVDGDRAVAVERHQNTVTPAGKGLVDGVVDDLVDHVVQARAVVGVADIHARPLAHGIEAAQHLDRFGAVFLLRAVGRRRVFARAHRLFLLLQRGVLDQ
jgi:hypothetical protein